VVVWHAELLAAFLEVDNIKHHYKNRLVGSVLNGYLSLRKLVVQRTKLIDDTQDKLLELLEEMTTGTFLPLCRHVVSVRRPSVWVSVTFVYSVGYKSLAIFDQQLAIFRKRYNIVP